jgi:hypothetical protein
MSQRSTNTLEFRGIDERNLEDQLQAAREGYGSVQDMALNQLAQRIILLEQRVAVLEGGEIDSIEGAK